MTPASQYDASAIKTLEGLEAVRKRPAMYIGGTGNDGLTHLLWEILDNAVDEAAAGFATKVEVIFYRDGSISVQDNGRGIPVGKHPELGVSAVEVVFTELHAGGKFGGSAYGASGGLHGVGASVVNALSTKVDVSVVRDKKEHSISFQDQEAGHFIKGKFTPSHTLKTKQVKSKPSGTFVRFWPDLDIFVEAEGIDIEEVVERARNTCYLVPNMTITIKDQREGGGEPITLRRKGGLVDLVEDRSDAKSVTNVYTFTDTDTFTEKVPVDGKLQEVERECEVEVALRWVEGYQPDIVSIVNTIPTHSGGTHLAGFEKSVTRVINNYLIKDMRKLAKLSKDNQHKALKEDVQEGLIAAVKVVFPEPQFRGQTKQTLGTPAIEGIVSRTTYAALQEWFERTGNRTQIKNLANKVADAIIARVEARHKLESRRKLARTSSTGLPDKLADCRVHGEDAELILVEGDSAAGPAKRGRNSETMAILPLRGKIVNAAKATTKQVLANAEAKAIFTAMGAGAGQEFDLGGARYGRIVILCDADVDGSHIRCLLLTLINSYMKPLLTHGRVYSAQPPLYTTRVGDKTYRAYSEEERERLTSEINRGRRKNSTNPIKWQRFKGLGEMNVDELRYCALDPATRTLRQMTISDAGAAKEAAKTFDILMGDDVQKRRDYIIQNSQMMDREALDI